MVITFTQITTDSTTTKLRLITLTLSLRLGDRPLRRRLSRPCWLPPSWWPPSRLSQLPLTTSWPPSLSPRFPPWPSQLHGWPLLRLPSADRTSFSPPQPFSWLPRQPSSLPRPSCERHQQPRSPSSLQPLLRPFSWRPQLQPFSWQHQPQPWPHLYWSQSCLRSFCSSSQSPSWS